MGLRGEAGYTFSDLREEAREGILMLKGGGRRCTLESEGCGLRYTLELREEARNEL